MWAGWRPPYHGPLDNDASPAHGSITQGRRRPWSRPWPAEAATNYVPKSLNTTTILGKTSTSSLML
jgi:hypothetical protein